MQFEHKSCSELTAEANAIRDYIDRQTLDEFRRRFEIGLAEYQGEKPIVTHEDSLLISAIIQPISGGSYRVVLPEPEFPELYLLHAKKRWLRARAHKLLAHGP